MQGLLTYGRSIRQFENNSPQTVFVDAETYPSFFDRHLMHPARRIKVLCNDPNANIRAFYFQYLILCFEIDNPNFQFYIGKLNKFILDPNFVFLFLEEDDQNIFNDRQFKRFLLEFLEILDAGEFEVVEHALNKYPIADLVFVYFFRSLAIYAEITNDFDSFIDKNILFGFLLQNFSIDAAIYEEKCLKFYEAEVFVYEETPQQIYMVYKQIEDNSSENFSKNQIPQKHSRNSSFQSNKQSVNQNISMLEQFEGAENQMDQNIFKKSDKQSYQQIKTVEKVPLPTIESHTNQTPNKALKTTIVKPTNDPHPVSRESSKELNESGANRSTRATTIQAPETSFSQSTQQKTLTRQREIPTRQNTSKTNNYNQIANIIIEEPEIRMQSSTTSSAQRQKQSNSHYHNYGMSYNPYDQNSSRQQQQYKNQQNFTMTRQRQQPPKTQQQVIKDFSNFHSNYQTDSSSGNPSYSSNYGKNYSSPAQTISSPRSQNIDPYLPRETPIKPNEIPLTPKDKKPSDVLIPKSNEIAKTKNNDYIKSTTHQKQQPSRQFRASSNSYKQKMRDTIVKKLNISKQFTDSLTLMKMGEPYCTNIKNMKKRARDYRQSIINALK